jgi:hypothetical protein
MWASLGHVTRGGLFDHPVPLRRSRHEGYSSLTLDKGVPVSTDENTRLAQSAYEAFGRGDLAALAEVLADTSSG